MNVRDGDGSERSGGRIMADEFRDIKLSSALKTKKES